MVNQPAVFTFTAKDKDGVAIKGATVTTEFRRASDMKKDTMITFNEAANGRYSASITLPLAGCWDMKVLVRKGKDVHEIKGQTEIATLVNGKVVIPECLEGAPELDDR